MITSSQILNYIYKTKQINVSLEVEELIMLMLSTFYLNLIIPEKNIIQQVALNLRKFNKNS